MQTQKNTRLKIIGACALMVLLSFPARFPEGGLIFFLIALLVASTYFLTDFPKIKEFWDSVSTESPQKNDPIASHDRPYVEALKGGLWSQFTDSLGVNRQGKEQYISKLALVKDKKIVKKERATEDRSQVYEVNSVPRGLQLRFTIPLGSDLKQFEKGLPALSQALGGVPVEITHDGVGLGKMVIRTVDPLAGDSSLNSCVDAEDYAHVPVALSADGDVSLTLKNNSGLIVGGVPGSGKTAGISSGLIGPLLGHEATQFVVVDGKGGSDWEWIESRAVRFASTTKDLEKVLDIFKEVVAEKDRRITTQKKEFGNSNFWNLEPNPAHPLIIFVVDECQNFFDPKQLFTKEDKALGQQITAMAIDLVKTGRSAGILGIFMTQKPTADSLPTALRDNCGQTIAFRVKTSESAKAILGDVDLREVSPVEISKTPGRAVMEYQDELTEVQFPYVSEKFLGDYAYACSYLNRDFTPAT